MPDDAGRRGLVRVRPGPPARLRAERLAQPAHTAPGAKVDLTSDRGCDDTEDGAHERGRVRVARNLKVNGLRIIDVLHVYLVIDVPGIGRRWVTCHSIPIVGVGTRGAY